MAVNITDMRDRIASAAQVELRTRGLSDAVDIAYAIADRALADTQFETLAGYVEDVEAGGTLEEINARLSGRRETLGVDPIFSDTIAV